MKGGRDNLRERRAKMRREKKEREKRGEGA